MNWRICIIRVILHFGCLINERILDFFCIHLQTHLIDFLINPSNVTNAYMCV